MSSNTMSSPLFSHNQSWQTPASSVSNQASSAASFAQVSTPLSQGSRLSMGSSAPMFEFSPSLSQQIAAHRALTFDESPTARAHAASERRQEAVTRPVYPAAPQNPAFFVPTPRAAVSFQTPSPQTSPTVPQAPSSDLIFNFSPSLTHQIAQSRLSPQQAQGVSPRALAQPTYAASRALHAAVAAAPGAQAAARRWPPLRSLAQPYSFGSIAAQTTSSQESVQASVHTSDTGSMPCLRSPSSDDFVLGRWLAAHGDAPCRRPGTPMPPAETMQDATSDSDFDSDSDVTQGPCEHLNKRQRRS